MSRCYPFPPPGFVPRQIQKEESLIESIKKGTKEEVKREKKDRKHSKKRKERDNEAGRSRKKLHHKRQRKDDNANASKKVDHNERECMEKSCLTIELDHQTSSQTSSDSTLHSNKNMGPNHIQNQPLDGRHNNDSETSKRVLFHGKVQDYREAELMMTDNDQKQCSSRAAPRESVEAPPDALKVEKRRDPVFDSAIDITTKLCKEKKTVPQKGVESRELNRHTPLGKEKRSSRHRESTGPSKLCSKCPSSTAIRFLNLIENWSPDQVERKLTDSEDQEWWLLMRVGSKRHHQVSVQTSSSSKAWPSAAPSAARFLPEAELLALPFTVPF